MKIYFFSFFVNPISFLAFITLIPGNANLLNAQEQYLKDMQIESSTKSGDNNLKIPTNPFEILDKIRRANSMNDATKPSDAIDDALKSFSMVDVNEKI